MLTVSNLGLRRLMCTSASRQPGSVSGSGPGNRLPSEPQSESLGEPKDGVRVHFKPAAELTCGLVAVAHKGR
jgi:hypothetical protein